MALDGEPPNRDDAATGEPRSMPPELEDALVQLLTQALLADLVKHPLELDDPDEGGA